MNAVIVLLFGFMETETNKNDDGISPADSVGSGHLHKSLIITTSSAKLKVAAKGLQFWLV